MRDRDLYGNEFHMNGVCIRISGWSVHVSKLFKGTNPLTGLSIIANDWH